MDSSEEIGDYDNTTIGGIWSVFSWDRRDIRADDLPMMNSFAWPLGDCLNKTCLNGKSATPTHSDSCRRSHNSWSQLCTIRWGALLNCGYTRPHAYSDILTPPLTLDIVVQSWCPFNGWTSTLVHLFWGMMMLDTWPDDCNTGGNR